MRVLLVDFYSIFFRSYLKLKKSTRGGLYTSYGKETTGTYGFLKTVFSVIEKWEIDHIIIASDSRENFRKSLSTRYKANRKKKDFSELFDELSYVRAMIKTRKFPWDYVECNGIEADDVIYTLSRDTSHKFYILTGDKDLLQASEENVTILLTQTGRKPIVEMGINEICTEWKVEHPKKIANIKALIGDKSDNIPQVAYGVGKARARKMLSTKIPPEYMKSYFANLSLVKLRQVGNINQVRKQPLKANLASIQAMFDYLEIRSLKYPVC